MSNHTDAQIDAMLSALNYEGFALPFGARSRDYVSANSRGEERAQQLAALRAADEEADAQNRAALRRALQAAEEIEESS